MLITENKARTLLDRFYAFTDSVLRRLEVTFVTEPPQSNVTAMIATRDSERVGPESWVNVRLMLSDVLGLHINEATTTCPSVLSNGLQIGQFDDLYYFVFDPYTLEPENREDYVKSQFYISARDFRWDTAAYADGTGDAEIGFPLSLLAKRIYSVLQRRAKHPNAVITYRELANQLSALPFPFENLKAGDPRLNLALSEITAACESRSWPPLSALVVTARTGRPGKGYVSNVNGHHVPVSRDGWEEQIRQIRQMEYPPAI